MSTEPQRGEEKAQGWDGGWQGPGRGMSVKVAGRSLSLSSTEFTGRSGRVPAVKYLGVVAGGGWI